MEMYRKLEQLCPEQNYPGDQHVKELVEAERIPEDGQKSKCDHSNLCIDGVLVLGET